MQFFVFAVVNILTYLLTIIIFICRPTWTKFKTIVSKISIVLMNQNESPYTLPL